MSDHQIQKYGRILVDEIGIMKRRRLLDKGFQVAWADIVSWAVTDVVLASMQTGQERTIDRILELHCRTELQTVKTEETAGQFDALVDCVRSHLPDKQGESFMEKMQKLRASKTI